jgi:translation elongation factor EF-G
VEPARPTDLAALEEGLRLLHRADPLVQVAIGEHGEHVLAAAGKSCWAQ